MKSWLIIAVKVDGSVIESLDNANILVEHLSATIYNEVTILNTIPAGE